MSAIVSAMKEFSHPGMDEMEETDINRLVATTQTVSRNEWKYVADLNLDLEPDLPLVLAHGGELNQVILNMIVNAAHAIAETGVVEAGAKGKITITTRTEDDGILLSIRDTGAGIPDSVRARIFDPFFTSKEVGKGTGQGLAIAQSIIKNHGGRIHVDSEVGSGTCFQIWLPLASHLEARGQVATSPWRTA
ncbi:MAG: two-component system NtrC family sensor kinase [Polyangiales bacterium]